MILNELFGWIGFGSRSLLANIEISQELEPSLEALDILQDQMSIFLEYIVQDQLQVLIIALRLVLFSVIAWHLELNLGQPEVADIDQQIRILVGYLAVEEVLYLLFAFFVEAILMLV